MKIKVAVPNSLTSRTSKAEANLEISTEVSTESVSVDKRSTVSSPVIKVYGSIGVEATLELEATEVSKADRMNP